MSLQAGELAIGQVSLAPDDLHELVIRGGRRALAGSNQSDAGDENMPLNPPHERPARDGRAGLRLVVAPI